MQPSIPEENVFGEHDGSTFSATLCHGNGGWYFVGPDLFVFKPSSGEMLTC